jgi:ribose transport system permease protein
MNDNPIVNPAVSLRSRKRYDFSALKIGVECSRKELGIFGLLLFVCLLTGIKNPAFLGADNIQNLARLVGIYGIIGIGAGIVIITGGIDLSVGSIFALEGVLLAMALNDPKIISGLTQFHLDPVVTIVLGVIAIISCLGVIHGLLITRVPLQPFIVTLCGLMIYRALARYISGDSTEGFGDGTGYLGLMHLATGSFTLPTIVIFGSTLHPFAGMLHMHGTPTPNVQIAFGSIPNPFIIMVVIAVMMWFVVHRSVYGRYLFAVGRNEEAARYSGINSNRIIASAYVVAAFLAAIAGILLAFYTNSISPSSQGQNCELYAIAAAVVGGCSLRGGEGSVVGVLIGTTLIQVLQNLVNLLGIPSSLNFAVVGAVILIGVTVDEIVKKRSAKKAVAKG